MVVWNSLWMRKLMGKLGKTRRRKDKNLRARILGLPQLELFQEHLLGGTNEDVEVKQWLWVQRTLWREKWWEMRAISLWRASVVKSISLTGSVWYGMVWEIPSAEQRTRGRRDRASYLWYFVSLLRIRSSRAAHHYIIFRLQSNTSPLSLFF